MLSLLRKKHSPRWDHYLLVLAMGMAVALSASPRADAQGAGATTPEPVPAAAKTSEPAPDKPLPPRLDQDYAGQPKLKAEEVKEYQGKRLEIQKILKSSAMTPAQEQILVDYYRRYALARWTYPDEQNEVVSYRRDLQNDLSRCSGTPGHAKLQELVLGFMQVCTNPNTYATLDLAPTVRFNAVMMIGDLNEVERSGSTPPKPLPAALPILYRLFNDSRQIDAVKLGALLGIRRHLRLMDPDAEIPSVVVNLLASVIKTKDPERVRSEEGQAWFRLVAIQTFADIKGKPYPVPLSKELLKVIGETESPEFLRYEAASALGSIDFAGAGNVDMNAMLQPLGLLAVEVCDRERQRLRDETQSKKRPQMSGGYGGGYGEESGAGMTGSYEEMSEGGYGYGGMGAKPTTTKEDRQIERVRRRLKEGMTAALIGMGKKRKSVAHGEDPSGVSALAGNNEIKKQNVEAFSDAIHDFFTTIDTKEDDKQIQAKELDEAIAEVRTKLAEALEEIGGKAPESPEFKPLPAKKSVGGYGGEETMY